MFNRLTAIRWAVLPLVFSAVNLLAYGIAPSAWAIKPLDDNAYQNVGKPMDDFARGAGYNAGSAGFSGGYQLATIISTIITAFLSLLAIIFIIIIIVAGFGWMTAGGDSAKVDKAKDRIRNSIIGIIIIVLAYSITWFVFNVIVPWGGGEGANPGGGAVTY